jgi:hypothetical protein
MTRNAPACLYGCALLSRPVTRSVVQAGAFHSRLILASA